ncbi:PEP-CTERM sorting domain-containing protein [Pontiellaceae bacterium B1224]|nr:PEP-CTERM sorting domain-containing protein [Pontiellaceae bacterium B1224]
MHACMLCASWLAIAASAPADVVWSGEQNLSGYEQYIDLNFDSQTDVVVYYQVHEGDVFDPDSYTAILMAYIENGETDQILVDASNNRDAALPFGTLISDTPDAPREWIGGKNVVSGRVGDWYLNPPEPNTGWNGMLGETGEAYLGIAFDIDSSTHFGWVHVVLGENNPEYGFKDPITASWAYESTANTPISAGVIPEPSTGILAMIGSLALLFHARSRRRGKQGRF